MLGVGSPVQQYAIILCSLLFVMSVMRHKEINIRKKKVIGKEGEEVGSKWTEKEV